MITHSYHITAARFILAGMVFAIVSCSVFDTREPEDPGEGGGSTYIQPQQASDVIQNLQNAVAEMNVQNYIRGISEEQFEYTPSSGADGSGIWENWSYSDEQGYFSAMASSAEGFENHQLQLENEREDGSDPEIRYTAEYTITINHGRSTDDLPTVASGEIILELERDEDGLWQIVEWIDQSTGEDITWSDFRLAFTQ